jgi:hypothetical protein
METRITKRDGTLITIETTVDIGGSMLQAEESILAGINEMGAMATGEALKRFDADGEPIQVGGVKWYAKRPQEKYYQTPFGEVLVERHIYQRAGGGKIFCPLENGARIMRNATPRFAKMVSYKMGQGSAGEVQRDLEENHGRALSRLLVQELSAFVGAVVQAKEETWRYATPELEGEIETVSISVDGTCVLLREGQWREAMTGSISLYNRSGDRLHTIYIGAAPEYGKAAFFERMEREISHVKRLYPTARYIGIADGAKTNWDFLAKHVDEQILDFYHVSEYMTQAADAMFADNAQARHAWLDTHCTLLKHEWQGAQTILRQWESFDCRTWKQERKESLAECIRYFRNHLHQMCYKRYLDIGMPIGSGVTEAACKTLVKQRLCRSGMRWIEQGAQIVLSLRALLLTKTRWNQFWQKIGQYGVPEI